MSVHNTARFFSITEGSRNGLGAHVVHLVQRPRQFAAALEQWNDAFFRVHLYGGSVGVWISTYGVPAAEIKNLEAE